MPLLDGAEDALTQPHDRKGILSALNPLVNESTGGAVTLRPLPENAPYYYLALFSPQRY